MCAARRWWQAHPPWATRPGSPVVAGTPRIGRAAPWPAGAAGTKLAVTGSPGTGGSQEGAEAMTALAARGIRKSFGRRQVLTDVDLEVAAGGLVAVVGENGNGKTTLVRILAGDLRPDAGSVAIGGRSCWTRRSPWTRTCASSRPLRGSVAPAGP